MLLMNIELRKLTDNLIYLRSLEKQYNVNEIHLN